MHTGPTGGTDGGTNPDGADLQRLEGHAGSRGWMGMEGAGAGGAWSEHGLGGHGVSRYGGGFGGLDDDDDEEEDEDAMNDPVMQANTTYPITHPHVHVRTQLQPHTHTNWWV